MSTIPDLDKTFVGKLIEWGKILVPILVTVFVAIKTVNNYLDKVNASECQLENMSQGFDHLITAMNIEQKREEFYSSHPNTTPDVRTNLDQMKEKINQEIQIAQQNNRNGASRNCTRDSGV